MDYERLERILKDMQARGEPVLTCKQKVKNWIVRVESWGVELRSEKARRHPTREFTREEIEQAVPEFRGTDGSVRRALRCIADRQ